VGGTIGASHNQSGHRALDVWAIAIAMAGPLSLMTLGRWPRPAMWFVVAITVAYVLRDYAYGPVFASLAVAVAAAVVAGHRVTASGGLATVLLANFVIRPTLTDQAWSWPWLSGVLAWSLLVLAVGEVIRIRRERISAYRQARVESSRLQANEERLQIARELHDVVAHHLSLINVQAGVALHVVDRRPEQAQTALKAIKDASKDALVELRSLVGILRDEADLAPRNPSGTLASLDELVERSRHAGLALRTFVAGQVQPLPSAVELSALRIIQEAITNVIRHSGAQSADVTVQYDDEALAITVEDDGRGMAARDPDGSGLIGMRERAETLGGSLTVDTGVRGGVRVRAVLPVRTAA
jgi:signal transduction histidine kinase